MPKHRLTFMTAILLSLSLSPAISLAAATVSGSGTQSRGYPGHNAEIHGKLFSLPSAGMITSIDGQGTGGFWIEKGSGELVVNFNSMAEAKGYSLPAGSYRIIPNLANGANSSRVTVTFTCP